MTNTTFQDRVAVLWRTGARDMSARLEAPVTTRVRFGERSEITAYHSSVFYFLLLFVMGMAIAGSPAWAINKCTGPDGKVAFQDAPCADGRGGKIEVKPASGYVQPVETFAPSNDPSVPKPRRPMTETEKIEAGVAKSQRERRISLLETRLVPDAQLAITQNRRRCDQEVAGLQNKKVLAMNNLAGATWEQSISSEMAAIATRCDTQGRYLTSAAEALQKELSDLRAQASN